MENQKEIKGKENSNCSYPTQKQKDHYFVTGGMLGDCDCETDVCEHTLIFMIWEKGLKKWKLEQDARKLNCEIDDLKRQLKDFRGFDLC